MSSCFLLRYSSPFGRLLTKRGAAITEPNSRIKLFFDDWSTRLVTICSTAIQVSMGFQIRLAAASMAAVILETTGSCFSATAILSTQRASSSSAGPTDLLPTAWRNCLAGRPSGFLYLVILPLTFFVALVSTLAKTRSRVRWLKTSNPLVLIHQRSSHSTASHIGNQDR